MPVRIYISIFYIEKIASCLNSNTRKIKQPKLIILLKVNKICLLFVKLNSRIEDQGL